MGDSEANGDHLTIEGVELHPSARWSYRDTTERRTIDLGQEIRDPDPAWTHIDAAGHFHAWALADEGTSGQGAQTPTLHQRETLTPCPGGCGDPDCGGVTVLTWHCALCGEEVERGYVGTGRYSRTIVTGLGGELALRVPMSATPAWLIPKPVDGVVTIASSPIFQRKTVQVYGQINGVLRFGQMDVGPVGITRRAGDRSATLDVELSGRLHQGIGVPAVDYDALVADIRD